MQASEVHQGYQEMRGWRVKLLSELKGHLARMVPKVYFYLSMADTSCNHYISDCIPMEGGPVASWLVRSTPEWAVWVRALAEDIVLCSWERHFTLTVSLSSQVYKWVPANCWAKPNKLQGSDLRWTSIPSRGSRNTSSRLTFLPKKEQNWGV